MERGKMSYEKRRMGETEELDYQVLHVNWWVFKGTGEFCKKGSTFYAFEIYFRHRYC